MENKFEHKKMKSRFLMNDTTILNDTSCNGFSMVRTTRNIALFWEKRNSKPYLNLKQMVNQWCFEWCSSKQMKILVDVGVYLKPFSSMMLKHVQLLICHGRGLGETEHKLLLQVRFDGSKCLQRLVRWWRNQECSRVFWRFWPKMQRMWKWQLRENQNFCTMEAAIRVEKWQKNSFIFAVLLC